MRQNKILAIIAISMGGMFIGVHFFSPTRNTQALWLGIPSLLLGIGIFLVYRKCTTNLTTHKQDDYTLEQLNRDLERGHYDKEPVVITDCMHESH